MQHFKRRIWAAAANNVLGFVFDNYNFLAKCCTSSCVKYFFSYISFTITVQCPCFFHRFLILLTGTFHHKILYPVETLFLWPQTHMIPAQLVCSTPDTCWLHTLWSSPISCQFTKLVIKTLFFHHRQVALPSLSLTTIVIPHGPWHLLIVHLLWPVGLHLTPGSCKLHSVGHLEAASFIIHPGYHTWIVARVVKHVPYEDVQWR